MRPFYRAFTVEYDEIVSEIRTRITVVNSSNKKSARCDAVWDSGSQRTALSQDLINKIGCEPKPKGQEQGHGKGKGKKKEKEVFVYEVDLRLPNSVTIKKMPVLSSSSINGCDILIGMDIFSIGDFVMTNYNGKTMISFSAPSHDKKIDLAERADKLNKKGIGKYTSSFALPKPLAKALPKSLPLLLSCQTAYSYFKNLLK